MEGENGKISVFIYSYQQETTYNIVSKINNILKLFLIFFVFKI